MDLCDHQTHQCVRAKNLDDDKTNTVNLLVAAALTAPDDDAIDALAVAARVDARDQDDSQVPYPASADSALLAFLVMEPRVQRQRSRLQWLHPPKYEDPYFLPYRLLRLGPPL